MWGRWAVAAAAFVIVGAAAASARAGVTIVFQHGTSPPATMAIDGDKIRVDNPEREGKTTSMIIDGRGTSPTFDGNAVDLDRTMAGMAENGLQYGASAKAAGKKLAILRYSIDGGG